MVQFDEEYDLVIVGFGAAGAATALTATKLGASVLLAEKQASDAHTPNTRMSRGIVMTMDDVEKGTTYLSACAGEMVPLAPLRAFAQKAVHLRQWLADTCPEVPYLLKVSGAEQAHKPGAETISAYQAGHGTFKRDPKSLSGRDLYASLRRAVEKTKTKIAWSSPARRLIRNESGDVIGVTLETPAGMRNVRARKGVVLSSGGFEYDEKTKLNNLRAYPTYFYGNPDNTGDGLRMAQDVGAEMWHMNQMIGRAIGFFKLPNGLEMGMQIGIDNTAYGFEGTPAGYVITDRSGKRFANENAQALLMHSFFFDLLLFDSEEGHYPRIPCYWFFDERRRKTGPLSSLVVGACAVGLYDWSEDNSKEIANGWISKGDTIREAAAKAGLEDPDTAAREVAEYNRICAGEAKDPFGRPRETLVPLDQGPYYCMKLWPGGSNTTGGPRRDEFARIVNVFGDPIPGLYGAGELGQVSGLLYPADGANLCEAICFGQIAAESAITGNRK